MIYTITLNPSLDYHIIIDQLTPKELNVIARSYLSAGGKGINVSKVVSNIGHCTKALGLVGGFIGEHLIQILDEEGLANDFVELSKAQTRINIKIKADS